MRRSQALAALAVVPLLAAVTAWWLLGDLSEPGDPQLHDHLFHPPTISRGVERVVGASATVLLMAAAMGVAVGWRRGLLSREDRRAATPLVAAALLIAFAERVLTAGVSGANIGGGMVLLAGPFVLVPVLAVSAVRWYRLLRSHLDANR
jgi:hypothetical protein